MRVVVGSWLVLRQWMQICFGAQKPPGDLIITRCRLQGLPLVQGRTQKSAFLKADLHFSFGFDFSFQYLSHYTFLSLKKILEGQLTKLFYCLFNLIFVKRVYFYNKLFVTKALVSCHNEIFSRSSHSCQSIQRITIAS